ncbi:MAG: hypothetical protein CTY37_08565, partial [Methylotenera sp.]
TEEEKTALKTVLNEFFTETDHGYLNDRCYQEIEKYRANTSAKARAGIASAAARKKKSTEINMRSTSVEQDDTLCLTNQEPLTNNHKPIKDITPQAMLEAMGVPKNLAKDWLAVRKAKKAAATQTAFDAIKKHAEENNYTFVQAVQIATENNWSGFKVNWLTNQGINGNAQQRGVSVSTDDAQLMNMAKELHISTTGLSKPSLVAKLNKAIGVQ